MKKRIVVICPGRGSYTKDTLGYLKNAPTEFQDFLQPVNQWREELGDPSISELDNMAKFQRNIHTKGEHASPLIYSCSALDFLSIDQEKYEIVGITGNSMGWYLAAAFGGGLSSKGAFDLIQTMGSMMKDKLVGGQIIYPITSDDWTIDPIKSQQTRQLVDEINSQPEDNCYVSIELGGYLVIGGKQETLTKLLSQLPPIEAYPFQLMNHGAFHTPLLFDVSDRAFRTIHLESFTRPRIPLIDGRGRIWTPYSTNIQHFREYTLGTQVYDKYNFTQAIEVSLKEFCPDHLVLLGPGNTLGGAIGQILIKNQWNGIQSKADFVKQQKADPFLLSMGLKEQASILQ